MVKLQSVNIYWNPGDSRIRSILNRDEIEVEQLDKSELEYLIKELDRRLVQLWDKVRFERENKLVDYSSVDKRTHLGRGVDKA